ncbi:MAG: hypothetical protein GY716_12975 [bacterium]|nr:hypothetical protein [bacterium]
MTSRPIRLPAALAILGGSLLIAVLAGSGTVYRPPIVTVVGAGALALVALGLVPERMRRWAAPAGAVVAGVAAGHVLLRSGVPGVHDLMHFWGIWAYGRCVGEGVLYPEWIPYIGAGVPLLEFYGPLNFLLALPGILLGATPLGAWKIELLTAHVLTALSTLAAARMIGVGRRGALLAAAAMAFAPWRLAVFHYRGALGEANAFVFIPLVVGSMLSLWRKPGKRAAVVLAASCALLTLTHVVSLLTTLVVMLPVLLVDLFASRAGDVVRRGAILGATLAIAAALTAAWWLPVLFEVERTSMRATTDDNPSYVYAQQGIAARETIQRRQWDRVRAALTVEQRREEGRDGEQMPFYCGAVLLALALSAPLWTGRRETWPLVAGLVVALSMCTVVVAAAAGTIPLFGPVRFPWRFLTPASVVAVLLVAHLPFRGLPGGTRGASALFALVVACLAWDALPYTGSADRIPPYRGVAHFHTDNPQWTHWDRDMRVAQIDVPRDARVRNLELPPADYTTALDWFFPAYYEWLTPTVYREYWASRNSARLAEAGVSHNFSNDRPTPQVWPARPYAGLEVDGRRVGPAVRRTAREPGRIVVEADVPASGARLVVLEQMFPGWRARVGSGPWRDALDTRGFLGVELQAGAHRVELRYGAHTAPRRAGRWISLLTLAAIGVAWVVRRRSV